eukprot:2207498-Ditylum_brightwellii.AAC.1
MTKHNGKKEKTDEENAEVFVKHFSKVFNNPVLLPCDASVLPLVPTRHQFSELTAPPDLEEVRAAIKRMAMEKYQAYQG